MKAIVVTDQAAGTVVMTLVERPEPQAAISAARRCRAAMGADGRPQIERTFKTIFDAYPSIGSPTAIRAYVSDVRVSFGA
jgi:hypothetical protein